MTHRLTVPGTRYVALVNADVVDLPRLLRDLERIGGRRHGRVVVETL